jgi:hypothetical protein
MKGREIIVRLSDCQRLTNDPCPLNSFHVLSASMDPSRLLGRGGGKRPTWKGNVTLWGQNAEILNATAVGTYSYQWYVAVSRTHMSPSVMMDLLSPFLASIFF